MDDWLSKYKMNSPEEPDTTKKSVSSDWLSQYSKPASTEQVVASLPKPEKTFGQKYTDFVEKGQDYAEEIPIGAALGVSSVPRSIVETFQFLKDTKKQIVKTKPAWQLFDAIFPKQSQGIYEKFDTKSDQAIEYLRQQANKIQKPVEEGVQAYREGYDLSGQQTRPADELDIGEKAIQNLSSVAVQLLPAIATGGAAAPFIGGMMEAGQDSAQVYDELLAQGKSKQEARDKAELQYVTSAIVNTISDKLGIFGDTKSIFKRILNSELSEVPAEVVTNLTQNILTGKTVGEGLAETALITAMITPVFGVAGHITVDKEDVVKNLEKNEEFKKLSPEQKQEVIVKITGGQSTVGLTPEEIQQIANEFEEVKPYLKQEKPADEAMFKKQEIFNKGDTVNITNNKTGEVEKNLTYHTDTGDSYGLSRESTGIPYKFNKNDFTVDIVKPAESLQYKTGDTFIDKTDGEKLTIKKILPEKRMYVIERADGENISVTEKQMLSKNSNLVKEGESTISYDNLPEPAKGALQSQMRVRVTNEGVPVKEAIKDLQDKTFIEKDYSISDIQKSNPDIFTDNFTKRGSMTKGSIVIDSSGEVIDGNNRVREAFDRGETSIKAYVEISKAENETFKKETDQEEKLVSAQRGVEKIKSYQKRLGIRFPTYIYSKIFTGKTIGGSPEQAFGMYLDNTISLAEAITETTADHEIGHFVFRNLENIPLFEGITREQLYAELRAIKGNEGKSKIQLEESLMENFELFAKRKEQGKPVGFKGKIKAFFENLYQSLQDLFSISKEEKSSIDKFYDTLYFGKSKDIITFENTGKASAFMEARFKEFGEDEEPAFKVSWSDIENEYDAFIEEESIPTINEMPPAIGQMQMQLEWMKQSLEDSPGAELVKLISKKEGEYMDSKNPYILDDKGKFKYTEVQREKIQKQNKRRKNATMAALEETQYSELWDDPDAVREIIGEYQDSKEKYKLYLKEYKDALAQYKTEQKDAKAIEKILNDLQASTNQIIRDNKKHQDFVDKVFGKGFKVGEKAGIKIGRTEQKGKSQIEIEGIKRENELQKLKENITKRLYTRQILSVLKAHIPRKKWSTYMTRLTQIGTSETKFTNLLESIYEEKTELDIAAGIRSDESTVRSAIGFLKHIYDVEPSLILSIKKDLGFTKSIRKMDLIELLQFKEELKKRIQFRKDNPVNYLDYASLEEPTTGLHKLAKMVDKFDKNIVAPLERKVKQISKPLYESLMTVFFQEAENNTTDSKNVKPLVDIFNEATPEDQLLITQKAQSADEGGLRMVLEKYSTPEEVGTMLENARQSLNRIHSDLKSVDVDVPYRGFFFPRKMKPLEMAQADLMLKTFEYKMGKKATDIEKTQILNNLIRGFNISQMPFITLSGKKFEAHRMLETIPDELLHFYEDFATALQGYIASANAVVEQRKFFGKSIIDGLDYDANLENSIGAKVLELLKQKVITIEQTEELKDTLQTLFVYKLSSGERAVQQFTSDYIYPLTLGQLTSTFSQLKDLSMQTLMDVFAGQFNTIGKQTITPEDVNLSESIAELESSVKISENKIAQFGKKVMTPFGKADKFFLTTFINASYKRMVKLSKSNNPRFSKELENIFGKEEAARLISDLKTKTGNETASELPEGVKRWIYGEVGKLRPITRLQKARGAIRNPAYYTLRNFMIKQLEFVRVNSFDHISEGVKNNDKKQIAEGIGKFVAIMTYMALLGAGVDELKDWILGKTGDRSFWDRIMDNMLMVFGMNNYMINMSQQQGIGKQVIASYTPAVLSVPGQIIDDAVKDITGGEPIEDIKSIKRFPLIGNIYYNRFGGGSD